MATPNRSDWTGVTNVMTPVFEFTTPQAVLRGRSSIQIQNIGPGSILDFTLDFRSTDDDDCPRSMYLGSADCAVDGNGYLMNGNIIFCSTGWPVIAPNAVGSIVFIHQYFQRVRLSMKADSQGAVVQVFAKG